ncbi:MAG: hypothetical protein ACRD3S_10210, partial [Terracidiphilus sp.]
QDQPAPPKPAVGAAVIAAVSLAALATLALGIIPGTALSAAQSAAHTLQVPPQPGDASGVPLQSPQ